uniref:Uncharacterized protein n=1 Tax=Avena sativa TaxID=4498 RepID=A0ACD5Z2V8_AVESA
MAEMEDALRSCMEQLLIAREEREQIIVEAANEISSQQKVLRDLQHSLEVANKKAAKLAAENNSLCKAIDAKDKLARELRESKAASDEQLAGATAKLEAAQKQSASLRYEARMLQKELEVRSQEREYDLKSVDAARAQHAESLKKIALLEAECQRLRAMVRKRLPGPAALAKMRDEVDQQQQQQPSRAVGASPRRQRSATPTMSPSRSVTPMSPRSVTPRRGPSDLPDQSYAVRLRAVEDENNALKRVLATRDTELQFARMKYADEVCKLSAVQGQLKELTEESKRLCDANAKTESWASALVSELDHLRAGKQGNGASSVMVSDMSLLDDFAEIEKLEMASGSVMSEKNDKFPDQNGSVSNGHPEWVHDVWELVNRKHEASGESIGTILEEIRRALDQSPDHNNKGDASEELYDRAKVRKMVRNLIEKITAVIRVSAKDNVARSGSLLHDKPEFVARLEYLVHVCHDVLHEKAKLENFIEEVCLVLEYIVNQYFSNRVRPDTMDGNTKNFDGDESSSAVNTNGEHDMQSATSTAAPDIGTEAHQEPIQSARHPPEKVDERQLNEELAVVMLHKNYDMEPGRMSSYYEIESHTDDGTEDLEQEGKQLATNSEISAAADKLAECQETITTLSKQLQALQTLPTSGILDFSMYSPRPSSAADYKPQSLGSILADEGTGMTEAPSSPAPKQVRTKKEQGEPDAAAPRRSMAQEQLVDADGEASGQAAVQPVLLEPRRDETPADPRKKKRGPSLLGRMIFRKRVEGSSS